MKSFCFSGVRLNDGGESKATVTERTRIGWMKFRECGCYFMEERFC